MSKILVALPIVPWPLNSGGNAAMFSTLQCLCSDHEFVVVIPLWRHQQKVDLEVLKSHLPQVRFRGIQMFEEAKEVPENETKARQSFENVSVEMIRRTFRILRRVMDKVLGGNEVHVSDDVRSVLATRERELRPADEAFYFLSHRLIETLQQELDLGVDLVQVEFSEFLSLGTWLPRSIPKIFVQVQIHYVYSEGMMIARSGGVFTDYVVEFTKCRELACLETFDGIIAYSEVDRKKMINIGISKPCYVSPYPIPADVTLNEAVRNEFSGKFCFLGSHDHHPNADALVWLLEGIWPLIQDALPEAVVEVIGNWPDEWRKTYLGLSERVKFLGFVDDLAATMDGGILLTPLRIGSGIRTKILVALARGVPNVSTTIGAEGLQIEEGRGVLIRDDEEGFAQAAVELAKSPERWRANALGGVEAVRSVYTSQAVRLARNQIYEDVFASHRKKQAVFSSK